MLFVRLIGSFVALALLSAPTSYSRSPPENELPALNWPSESVALSVMTYNLNGLPWPVAGNRSPALAAIGQRLRLMRSRSIQPHIVLFQEAFTDDAKKLARVAGYEFVAFGPSIARPSRQAPLGQVFTNGARWAKGERSDNLVDSGLMILSDYPIVRTSRHAFPQGACAGFDCLASKGVLIAWIDVPELAEPLAVVDTHLNSRRSTHVSVARADAACDWQLAYLRKVLEREIKPGEAVVFGGDFNIGHAPTRIKAFQRFAPLGAGQNDGLSTVVRAGGLIHGSGREAGRIVSRNKDRILSRDGDGVTLRPSLAWVPFGLNEGDPKSDHAGFVINYEIMS